jgi:hypothetical protein
MADGPAIDLAVTRDDVVRAGRLFVDGREQWGDLVFETTTRRATLTYWLHEVLRPWPAWVRAWPTIAVALAIFNAVLAWACALAVGVLGPAADAQAPADVAPLQAGVSSCATAPSAARVSVWLIVITGVLLTTLPIGRYQSLDLIDALPDAHIETSWPSLHGAISVEPALFAWRIHRAIVALPTSTIRWEVDVPRGAVLRLGAAMRADMWDRQSDGIQMRVYVDHAGGRTTAADLTLFPLGVPEHRGLVPLEIPLQPWAGQRIVIVLETTPERWGNAVNDVPVWTEPRIEWSRALPPGAARVVWP